MTATFPAANLWPDFLDPAPALRQRGTAAGPRQFREVPIPLHREDRFSVWWKANAAPMIRLGWWPNTFNGRTTLQQWLTMEGNLSPIALERVARMDAPKQAALALTEAPLKLAPLPHGLESKLRPYQVDPARQLFRAVMEGNKEWNYPGAVDLSDMGCHAAGQLILMADGHRKRVETIRVGEFVMGWKGPQTVTQLKRGRAGMARIVPVKGEPFTVNQKHILTVQFAEESISRKSKTSGRIVDITVEDYLALPRSVQDRAMLFRAPVNSWGHSILEIEPYFLGVYLGDGCSRHGRTAISITKPDVEIESEVKRQAGLWQADYVRRDRSDSNPSHFLNSCRPLTAALERLGLYRVLSESRFIPHDYLTGSWEQRSELLAGLLDTDGHRCVNGGYDFISKSWDLADGICFLARSLGLAAYLKPSSKTCQNGFRGDYWRVSISGDCSALPLRIPRKRSAPRQQKKSVLRTNFRVELLPEDDFYGFSLDGDGRFLLGDFTVTHNTGKTYMALAAALATGQAVIVLCPSVGKAGWERAFTHFGADPEYIGTYEGLRGGNRPHIAEENADGSFTWKKPDEILLILDEAQALRHDDTLNVRLCSGAVRQRVPIIIASATVAISPLEMRFAGRIVGLHQGGDDWNRFLMAHGCTRRNPSEGWKWNGDMKHLAAIHSRLFPRRGCRVRKEDLGSECPETEINVLPITCAASQSIEKQWKDTQDLMDRLTSQGQGGRAKLLERKARMKVWQMAEAALVPHIAARAKADVAAGRSVAIFVSFTETRQQLGKLLNTNAGFYGGQSPAIRKRLEAEFQANRCHILISNIKAGGASVSLHDEHGERPRTSYIFPTDFPVDFEQATGRVDRVGGKSKSLQWIPCVAGTLSEKMVHRTRKKMLAISTLNNGRGGKSRI